MDVLYSCGDNNNKILSSLKAYIMHCMTHSCNKNHHIINVKMRHCSKATKRPKFRRSVPDIIYVTIYLDDATL